MIKYNPKSPLISIHIPKCGGSSFRKVMETWFPGTLYSHYYDEVNNCLPEKVDLYLDIQKEPFFKPNICIYGHFNKYRGFGINQYYPQVQQFITILRDPKEIIISNYYYNRQSFFYRNGKKIDNSLSLNETFESIIDGDLESYYLTHFPNGLNKDNFKEFLHEKFIFIGIMEEYEKSMKVLSKLLNKPYQEVSKKNTTKRDGEEINNHLLEKFRKKFEIDYMIYDYAKEILNKQNDYLKIYSEELHEGLTENTFKNIFIRLRDMINIK